MSIAATAFPFCGANRKQALIHWWCKKLVAHFNLTVVATGQLPNGKTQCTMFVANHISWADIHAINSIIPVRFVAKMEIKDWPVFGYLVKKSGTIFINRSSRKDTVNVVQEATMRLQAGDNLCFFPEGTTTEGNEVLPFKSSILQAAISAQASITPVAIRYVNPDGSRDTSASYAGETSLLASMRSVLRHPSPKVELHFFSPILPLSRTRQEVAKQAHQVIKEKLAL
jgi:1-acyl-sn-glycerol-3-phosphate acyltransferase